MVHQEHTEGPAVSAPREVDRRIGPFRFRQLIARNVLVAVVIIGRVATRRIPVAQLRAADPQLQSLRNCNRPEDYAEALNIAGFGQPENMPF